MVLSRSLNFPRPVDATAVANGALKAAAAAAPAPSRGSALAHAAAAVAAVVLPAAASATSAVPAALPSLDNVLALVDVVRIIAAQPIQLPPPDAATLAWLLEFACAHQPAATPQSHPPAAEGAAVSTAEMPAPHVFTAAAEPSSDESAPAFNLAFLQQHLFNAGRLAASSAIAALGLPQPPEPSALELAHLWAAAGAAAGAVSAPLLSAVVLPFGLALPQLPQPALLAAMSAAQLAPARAPPPPSGGIKVDVAAASDDAQMVGRCLAAPLDSGSESGAPDSHDAARAEWEEVEDDDARPEPAAALSGPAAGALSSPCLSGADFGNGYSTDDLLLRFLLSAPSN
jgi:hypothetical protein